MPQPCVVPAVPEGCARSRLWRVALLLTLALSLGFAPRVPAATTWTVCASGCDYTSIKAAIAARTTRNGDTLAIGAGTYTEARITVNKSLTLRGDGAADTIVQAATTPNTTSGRVFTIASGVSVTIRGLTIRYGSVSEEGYPHSYGGGLENWGTLTLSDSIIRGNSVLYAGGGLFNGFGTLMLTNSTVSGNSVSGGTGGGLLNWGTLRLTNSTISGNSARHEGGGIRNNGGTLTLTNSTISGNSAQGLGGGVSNSGTMTLINSTVSGNTASGDGGGLYNGGELTLMNSTVSGNTAGRGGGLYTYPIRVTLTNSIVANNLGGGDCATNGSGFITSTGYNLDSDGSCQLTDRTDRPGIDPLLGPLQKNGGPTFTRALRPGSPAIDTIPWGTHGCGTTLISDQRWQARPHAAGGRCDIGAYEVEVAGQPLEGWVTGLTPQTVVCKNVTTEHEVTLSDPATTWNCEDAGLQVAAGDRVSMRVHGPVKQGATDVGGAVTGMTPSSGGCTNLTTGQQMKFQQMVGATAASCVAAGLAVHPGDDVQMSVQGVAE
jgi:hypothetical protein